MKAKKVSVCLIALISVLAILVYPLLSDVRINDFPRKLFWVAALPAKNVCP